MQKVFSIDTVIYKGWEAFKKSAAGLILIMLASFLLQIAYNFTLPGADPYTTSTPSIEPFQIALTIILYLLAIFLQIVMQQASLDAVHGRDINSQTFKNVFFKLPYLIAAGIVIISPFLLIGLSVSVFPPLAIVLGILIGIPYIFFIIFNLPQVGNAILENKMGPIEAIKHSHKIMKGNKFKYFLIQFCFAGINLLGLLCLFVGLIVTVPATTAMKAQLFKEIN